MPTRGTIYLIHFDRPFKHARHYIGWSSNTPKRFEAHIAGRGSKLLAAVAAAGIGFNVVRVWGGTRSDERRLHRRKNTPRDLCPTCSTRKAVMP